MKDIALFVKDFQKGTELSNHLVDIDMHVTFAESIYDLPDQCQIGIIDLDDEKFGNVEFVEEIISGRKSWKDRKIAELIKLLKERDNLIVSELSRLGRSMLEIMELLSILLRNKINVYVVKGDYELKDNIHSKVLTFAFSLASEIERELISQRTKEALKKARAEGKKIGRPKGPGKSSLDNHKDQIKELLDKGVSISSIAKILGKNYNTVYKFVKDKIN